MLVVSDCYCEKVHTRAEVVVVTWHFKPGLSVFILDNMCGHIVKEMPCRILDSLKV